MISRCEKGGTRHFCPLGGHYRNSQPLVILIVDIAGGLVL